MSEEQNLKFDLNNNDDVIKFMNLEFVFEKADEGNQYNLFAIEGGKKYQHSNTLTLNDDSNKIDQFVDFLQTEFFIPQVNLEETFNKYEAKLNYTGDPGYLDNKLVESMTYHPDKTLINQIEILVKKNPDLTNVSKSSDDECKNLSELDEMKKDNNKTITFTYVDAMSESNDDLTFNFLDFKRAILEELKQGKDEDNDEKKLKKYKNMIISIHRICDLSELEKLLHKYFSCFNFTIDGSIRILMRKDSLLKKIKEKYEESMNNKMKNDEAVIDNYHTTQDQSISPYITKLKKLTGWTGNDPEIKLKLIQSEMSKEEFTAIKEILNKLIKNDESSL